MTGIIARGVEFPCCVRTLEAAHMARGKFDVATDAEGEEPPRTGANGLFGENYCVRAGSWTSDAAIAEPPGDEDGRRRP